MKSTTPMRIRLRRFVTDRSAYSSDPSYAFELVALALIVVTVFWPIFGALG